MPHVQFVATSTLHPLSPYPLPRRESIGVGADFCMSQGLKFACG